MVAETRQAGRSHFHTLSRFLFEAAFFGTKNEAHLVVTNLAPKTVPQTVGGTALGAKFVTAWWASFLVPQLWAQNDILLKATSSFRIEYK